ncbi:MAG: hypothetical protein KatS3mg026_0861 [Bacteroidia bacterium]|nr:MAG: hypothetical protein KatS3mg026_0861 [Bacteroidia bacterium]
MRLSGVFVRNAVLVSLAWAQQGLQMGARLQLARSAFLSQTERTSPLLSQNPTYKAGLVGFFAWNWNPFLATGLEVAYQSAGQSYYGLGVNGDSYQAQVRLHYLRMGLSLIGQYAQGPWGAFLTVSPSLAFLTQADLQYQGDSLQPGNLVQPQIIQNTLAYLSRSTNPDDRLALLRMYRRLVPTLSVSGGLRVRLAPQVWLLGLVGYERALSDIENKSYRFRPEAPPLYAPERSRTFYQLLSLQVGLQYEVFFE